MEYTVCLHVCKHIHMYGCCVPLYLYLCTLLICVHMTAWIGIVMRMYEGMYVMLVCMYDNGTCESYPCVGTDGDLNIGLHCVGGGHSSVGRVAQHRDER